VVRCGAPIIRSPRQSGLIGDILDQGPGPKADFKRYGSEEVFFGRVLLAQDLISFDLLLVSTHQYLPADETIERGMERQRAEPRRTSFSDGILWNPLPRGSTFQRP
jgi:hypothetical protein